MPVLDLSQKIDRNRWPILDKNRHVATVLGRGRGGNSLSIGWCNSEASKHRCKRDGQTAKLRFRFKQSRRTRLIVDPPFEQLTFRQLARVCRINNVRRHNRGGITDLACWERSDQVEPLMCHPAQQPLYRTARFADYRAPCGCIRPSAMLPRLIG
jgi:hypothetical protein